MKKMLNALAKYNAWEVKEKKKWLRRLSIKDSYKILSNLYSFYRHLPSKNPHVLNKDYRRKHLAWRKLARNLDSWTI